MLVLSRRIGEAVVLTLPGDRQVTVRVTDIRSAGRVVLGIEAPWDVVVNRAEKQAEAATENSLPDAS